MRSLLEEIDSTLNESLDPPEDVVEEYSYGGCMWMALALNKHFGWEIKAQMERDKKHGDYIAHAYVVHPSGKEIDILGPQDHVDIFTTDVQSWNAKELLSFLGVPSAEARQKIREAEKAMKRYVIPKLQSKGLISQR